MSLAVLMRKSMRTPQVREKSRASPLFNWPRYPGGAIAGALIGVSSVMLFFIPALRSVLFVAFILAIVLWALLSNRSED